MKSGNAKMLSAYRIPVLMVQAYGKLITKEDLRLLDPMTKFYRTGAVRYWFIHNRTLKSESKRLRSLKLSKEMMVFELVERQLDSRFKGNDWKFEIVGRKHSWEGDYDFAPKPTKEQWRKAIVIGKRGK